MGADTGVVGAASVVQRFAAWSTRTPDAVALEDRDRSTTYAELAARVARTAAELTSRGVEKGDVVAVDHPRGIDYVVAVLAVQAVGAACLPLHPDDPPARLDAIVREAGATHVVAPASVAGLVAVEVSVDGTPLALDPVPAGAEDLSFVFATSGSTGTPKLVALPNRACVTGIDWAVDVLGVTPADRYLFRTATSFVTVLRHVMWPLATGGTCVVLPPGAEADLALVVHLLRRSRITVSTFIPSALRAALHLVGPGSLPALRHVLCGAEPLTDELRRDAAERMPDAVLHNLYAPTEAPMVTHHRCGPDDVGVSPLGPPVPGATMRVVTEGREAVAGETGEILVGGSALYSGYLRSGQVVDETTTDRWGGTGRLHPTGDLARVDEDGSTLVYVGRSGDFVKVRGYRVAPGEVEVALVGHPAVQTAVVVAVPSAGGSTLSAFVVGHGAVSLPEVREHLSAVVPAYMVPAQILAIDVLPLLPNGKVDRQALVERAVQSRPSTRSDPQDGWEATVLAVWQQVLGVREIGRDDAFLDLGGDSLAAVEMAFLLDDAFDTELPARIFRSAATVAELALACRPYVPEPPFTPAGQDRAAAPSST